MRAYNPQYKSRSFSFSVRELKELVIAWIIISLVFTLALSPGTFTFSWIVFGLAAITAGVGFLLHELAHKFVAQYYRCYAEFHMDRMMLFLAVILSFFGLVFAAPGAVYINGATNKKQLGHIAVVGPITNIFLAVVFYFVPGALGSYGFQINAWLAFFNMIPFGPLDGAKVLSWNKAAFGVVIGASLLLFLFGIFGSVIG